MPDSTPRNSTCLCWRRSSKGLLPQAKTSGWTSISPRWWTCRTSSTRWSPSNLRAAYRFYCGGEDFENAHTAEADTLATYEVLKAQLDRYPTQLKNDIECLSSFVGRKYVDFSGHLIYNDAGEAVINFGKHKGKTARQVYFTEPSYFAWIQQGSFTLDTKKQFEKLENQFKLEKLAEKFKRS